jgi:hypothetical protein
MSLSRVWARCVWCRRPIGSILELYQHEACAPKEGIDGSTTTVDPAG